MKKYAAFLVTAALCLPTLTFGATLYIDPGEGTFGLGDTFVANIRLEPEGECVNVAEVTVRYPTESLKAVDFSRGSSIISLWVTEPKIDVGAGIVTFSGGIPGGYCGRIQGDPSITNILGKIVFTVTNASAKKASIQFEDSALYAHDGKGTKITPSQQSATYSLSPVRVLPDNPWLKEVEADTIPPEAFIVEGESTPDVFGGKEYVVFSTTDKQSGLDHFEIFERGAWKQVTSPHQLQYQSLSGGDVRIRAIDKAGNIRLGDYATSSSVARGGSMSASGYLLFAISVLILLIGAWMLRGRKTEIPPQ